VNRVAVFLSGLAATGVGAFTRSCNSNLAIDMAGAWCGNPPPGTVGFESHAHCAGCAILLAGLAMISLAISDLLIRSNRPVMHAKVIH
jgi:hypothetical protein